MNDPKIATSTEKKVYHFHCPSCNEDHYIWGHENMSEVVKNIFQCSTCDHKFFINVETETTCPWCQTTSRLEVTYDRKE